MTPGAPRPFWTVALLAMSAIACGSDGVGEGYGDIVKAAGGSAAAGGSSANSEWGNAAAGTSGGAGGGGVDQGSDAGTATSAGGREGTGGTADGDAGGSSRQGQGGGAAGLGGRTVGGEGRGGNSSAGVAGSRNAGGAGGRGSAVAGGGSDGPGGRAAGGGGRGGRGVGGDDSGAVGGAKGGGTGGSGSGGAGGATAGGAGSCDLSTPPANVAAWIEESWKAEGRNNISTRKTWLADSVMKGKGEIHICVRYGATRAVAASTRDLIAPAMERWFNKWVALLYPYDCFPYSSITVKITGWAVKPGQESLLQWTDRTVPVYTEVSDGSDQAKGEPKCPDTCGFFFHPDHVFTNCPGGADNHFDYTLWMDDTLPSGAAAEGSDWGVRIPVASVVNELKSDTYDVMLHEMGHGFGISDYYSWKGSTPAGGSVMMIGSARGLTTGDRWMVRRYWKETKALRYP